jgi:bifunctional non-homologous end joining protein LigD
MVRSRAKRPAGAIEVDALPQALEPELATLVDRPRPGDWLYEIKFDGYRMLTRIEGKSIKIVTRRGNDWTSRFEPLRAALLAAKLPSGWYDGEIVVLDTAGMPNFNALQNAIDAGAKANIVFYLFDAPFMDGLDLRKVAVEERRAMLRAVLDETETLRFSQEVEGSPQDIVASACRLGLEGIIGKRRGSHYVHRRSEDWIKLKCVKRQEFVIGGYTWPDESRSDPGIGALLVGYADDAGVLQYAGKVGTGYTGEVSAMLRKRLDSIAQPTRPFAGPTGHDKHAQWVRPELVCEVTYNEWPEGGSLRHASFKGLREPRGKAKTSAHELVRVTHGNRVIDASTGLTKMDLVRYYAEVSPWMLPHVAGRPVYVARFPEGIEGIRIFQQHPEGMRGFKGTDPALWPGHEPAISIETAEDLVEAAQMDAIEIHTWNSTAKAILLPDRVVFDLDPGDGVTWPQIREGALLVKALLDELGLKSWVKTTGGKALHIFVPIKPELDYPTVRGFSEAVAAHLARTIPQRFVAKSGPRNRVDRIFIDYLRNGQSQSTAEAYSARARPGIGVSMPVDWGELPALDSGAHWDITNAPEYLARRKEDPWVRYWKTKQSLRKALAALR